MVNKTHNTPQNPNHLSMEVGSSMFRMYPGAKNPINACAGTKVNSPIPTPAPKNFNRNTNQLSRVETTFTFSLYNTFNQTLLSIVACNLPSGNNFRILQYFHISFGNLNKVHLYCQVTDQICFISTMSTKFFSNPVQGTTSFLIEKSFLIRLFALNVPTTYSQQNRHPQKQPFLAQR